jgi:hypothetical protein
MRLSAATAVTIAMVSPSPADSTVLATQMMVSTPQATNRTAPKATRGALRRRGVSTAVVDMPLASSVTGDGWLVAESQFGV